MGSSNYFLQPFNLQRWNNEQLRSNEILNNGQKQLIAEVTMRTDY